MNFNFNHYRTAPLVGVFALLLGIVSWGISGIPGSGPLQGISPTVIVLFVLWLYDRYGWRWPVLKLLVKVPDLNGVYNGHIEYSRNDSSQTKKCTLRIRQTASHTKVRCTFYGGEENKTESESVWVDFIRDDVGDDTLIYYYKNSGGQKSGDPLNQHDGFSSLRVDRDRASITLEGSYFTNRDPHPTKGILKVIKDKE